jgi:hypothetical protein
MHHLPPWFPQLFEEDHAVEQIEIVSSLNNFGVACIQSSDHNQAGEYFAVPSTRPMKRLSSSAPNAAFPLWKGPEGLKSCIYQRRVR